MKKLIVCFMASIALTGVSHAQLTGIQTLEPVQRAPATARGSVMGAQFDDSVGTQGAFMAPDACPNLDGYQPSVPGGYVVINGSCEVPCVVPMTTSSVTSSSCPVGQTGVVYTTTQTSYTCPSAYGSPLSSNSVIDSSNTCVVNIQNVNDLAGKWVNVGFWDGNPEINYVLRFVTPRDIYYDMVFNERDYSNSTPYSFYRNNVNRYSSVGVSVRLSCVENASFIYCGANDYRNIGLMWDPENPNPCPSDPRSCTTRVTINKSTNAVTFAGMWLTQHTIKPTKICQGDVYASPDTYGKLTSNRGMCLYNSGHYYDCSCTN